ncbi:unnamed protein product [Ectocarpus sp. CCAP 1310/34]|nr:unnamed protein product [Ectocarpus sp. CCAP 1310/34]
MAPLSGNDSPETSAVLRCGNRATRRAWPPSVVRHLPPASAGVSHFRSLDINPALTPSHHPSSEGVDYDAAQEYSNSDVALFWKSPSPFCQWTPSTFVVGGVSYVCAEQFFAAEKARLFGDRECLQNIMRVSDPRLHTQYGRAVRNSNQTLWEQERENIVLTGSYAKFSQNPEMRLHLLGSGDKLLAEASPWDLIWGIGHRADHPDACRPSRWRGLNLLGIALQKVRQLLRSNAPPPERSSRLSALGGRYSRPIPCRGLIQHSTSPYSSSLVAIPEKSGGVRITVNYRKLNKLCALSQLPIPRVDDTLDKLLKGKIYSLFDMKSSFHQITVHRDTIPLTAFVTSSGLFEWLNMPQGTTIRSLFERLRTHNLNLTPRKLQLAPQKPSFLGTLFSPDGVQSNGDKVIALTKMPMPKDTKQLRALLGGLSYYRKYLPQMAKHVRPLTTLLKKNVKFEFTDSMESAIRQPLAELASPPVLVYPDWDAVSDGSRPFRLYCDASKDGFGGTLEQEQPDGSVRPIVFISYSRV